MSGGTATLSSTINLIRNNEKNKTDPYISTFPYTANNRERISNEYHSSTTIILFDLTKDGQSLSKILNSNNTINDSKPINENNECLEILHLPIPTTLIRRSNSTFNNILNATMDQNQKHFLSNLLQKSSQYVFYDGESTLTNCLLTTFWTIEKFAHYIQETFHKKFQIMIYEPTQIKLDNNNSENNNNNTINNPKLKKKKFDLTMRLPYKSKRSSDAFIESLKEDLIQYSPDSLCSNFHLNFLDSFKINHLLKLPIWLREIIDITDERIILNNLWTKFNILEHLEKMRLKSCIIDTDTDDMIPNNKNNNNNITTSKPINNKKINNNNNIYSLSFLQKEFKQHKHLEHNLTKLQVSIPPKISTYSNNGNNNNNNNMSDTFQSPTSNSSDTDILTTPLYKYEIDKAIQSFQKNRYSNILPYEHSRVKLLNQDDYFNANYIKIPQINDTFQYIATQAPLPNTISDFWSMVWMENVKIIISLNSLNELKLRKWDIYWGDNLNSQNNISVSLIKQWDNICGLDGIILRQFDVNNSSSQIDLTNNNNNHRIVYQLQYSNWSDSCGVKINDLLKLYKIRSLLTFNELEFINEIESFKQNNDLHDNFIFPVLNIDYNKIDENMKSPLLVHCSAGCGRTGVFITLDYILNIFRDEMKDRNKIDVWNMQDDLIFIIINELRKQRISMVQNLTQYIACYDEIIQYFILLNNK